MKHPLGLVTVVALTNALVMSGCTPAPNNVGPLEVGGDVAMFLCIDPTLNEVAAGVTYIANKGTEPAIVESVNFIGATDVEPGQPVVIDDDTAAYTINQLIPAPSTDPESIHAWAFREPAIGYVLEPGKVRQLILPGHFESSAGNFEALEVSYSVDGVSYSGRNKTGVAMGSQASECK